MSRVQSSRKRDKGSTILETGPALLVLFMFLFFPVLDVMALGMLYTACYSLNDIQLREAANLPSAEATAANGIIKKVIPEKWLHTGLGAFVRAKGNPQTEVTYVDGQKDTTGTTDKFVLVKTTVTAHPFLLLPFFFPVPGMSAPMTYSISTRRMLENPHFAS